MKSLANAVSHLERNAQADLDAGEGTILLTCKTVLELCRAFRAAEKMRNSCYGDNSGGEYRPKCSDCEADMYEKHSDTCSFKEWDRVTGGADQSHLIGTGGDTA